MDVPFAQRLENAILAKLPGSLAKIQADLDEIELPLNVAVFEEPARAFLNEYYAEQLAEDTDGSEPPLLALGTSPGTAPAPFARSMTLFAIRQVMERWSKTLKGLEEAEDRKFSDWAKRTLAGQQVEFDMKSLAFKPAPPVSREVVMALGLVRHLLKADDQTLRRAASMQDVDGTKAFVRDLAAAILSGHRMRQLLVDMWDAATVADVDAVLQHPDVARSQHAAPIFDSSSRNSTSDPPG